MQPIRFEPGAELTDDRFGDDTPLLCCHGGMAPPAFWDPVVPHLGDYEVVVPERPGFGTCLDDAESTPAEAVLEREVECVRELVEAIRAATGRDPVLFGHSYGALTALEAATDARVAAVAAYEPAVLPEAYRSEADLSERMAALVEAGARREAVKRYVEQVLHPDGIDDLDAWLDEWPVWPDCVALAEEVVRMNRAVEQYRLPARLDVDAPAVVLAGTDGPDFLRESARNVHDALPTSRFVEFDALGHGGPGDDPERVAAAVDAFLRDRAGHP